MESNKYVCDINNINITLEKYGIAIIENVINDNEIQEMINGMWGFLENATKQLPIPIDRTKIETYKEFKNLYPIHSMLVQHWGIGHAQFIWNLRQNKNIINIFSKIWNISEDNLLVSFDGASFHMPQEITGYGEFKNEWYHTDQSYTRNNFECVQSWVTAYDVNENDATLSILEGSNKYHKEFSICFNKQDKTDWNKITEEELNWYLNKGCKKINIVCKAGSLVLWDSRTIHYGKEPNTRTKPNFRCVVYLCYTPRFLATESSLAKKQKAFNELRTTNHYPHKPKLFPKTPHTYGKPLFNIKSIEKPILNQLGYKLAGF